MAVVAYSSLGCGFLTGQIKNLNELTDPFRKNVPRVTGGKKIQKALEMVKTLEVVKSRDGYKSLLSGSSHRMNCSPHPGDPASGEILDALKISLRRNRKRRFVTRLFRRIPEGNEPRNSKSKAIFYTRLHLSFANRCEIK